MQAEKRASKKGKRTLAEWLLEGGEGSADQRQAGFRKQTAAVDEKFSNVLFRLQRLGGEEKREGVRGGRLSVSLILDLVVQQGAKLKRKRECCCGGK